MFKTDHNLRVLEKKIRQAVSLIDDLKKGGQIKADKDGSAGYQDLPLLRNLEKSAAKPEDLERYLMEREEIRRRVEKILAELEKVIG
jgi:uncharacterized membrane-anchored protein YjiN (DUF445 family)